MVKVEKYSIDSGVVYSTDIMIWAKLLIIGIRFIFALLVGLESLYIFERNLKEVTSKAISFTGVLLVSLLSGIVVYIGRFLRFNSWDILFNPIQLIKEIVISIDSFSIQCKVRLIGRYVALFTLYEYRPYAPHFMQSMAVLKSYQMR